MKKFLLIWMAILALIVFQTSLLAPWFSDYFQPDIILVFLAAATIVFGFQTVWPWIVLSGITLDLFSYSRVGTHVIIYILACYLVSFISRRFSVSGKGAGAILAVFLMPVISALDFWGALALGGIPVVGKMFNWQSLLIIGVITLENLVLFFAFYSLARRLKKYHSPVSYRIGK